MWNRADLKANAKKIFFGNYWKAVLVTLILTIILGGATNTITRRISNNQSTDWSIDQDFSGIINNKLQSVVYKPMQNIILAVLKYPFLNEFNNSPIGGLDVLFKIYHL